MNRLVVDVTQLLEWQGKLTGIPRVMNELSLRFGVEDDAVLVSWNHEYKSFREVLIEEIEHRDEATIKEGASQKISSFKRVAGRVVRIFPSLKIAYVYLRQKLQKTTTPSSLFSAFTFSEGDTFCILWGIWHDQQYIDMVVELNLRGVKIGQVVHDMLPLVTPQFSGHSTSWLANYSETIYPRCSLLIANSEHTKKDLIQWLRQKNLFIPPIKVIRLGDNFHVATPIEPQSETFRESGLRGQDFLLTVGTIEARKNHALLYYVYKLSLQRKLKLPKLVIVGRLGWMTDDIYTLMTSDPETKQNFVFLHDTTDEELAWLYRNCLFSIYPSFYEGWGLPIAESAAYGVPCLASNSSSMPEIAGDLIEYFSPVSTDECLKGIYTLLDSRHLSYARKKIRKYNMTSWDETYEMLNTYLRSI